MKRERSAESTTKVLSNSQNNTAAVDGYDAYFGTYEVAEITGDVIHKLDGALTQANVGVEVSRNLSVQGDNLKIELEASTLDNEPVMRVLMWKRIG